MRKDDVEFVDEDDGKDEKLKKVKEELNRCRKEREEYLAGWQRAKADFINARKDEEKARIEFVKFTETGLLRELLRIADSFDEALKGEHTEGMARIEKQLLSLFQEHNVAAIAVKEGDIFDPQFHEAIEGEGSIIENVIQKGYLIHDRVLRPARVKVRNSL